jgi:alpha-beta hydrolase superfamily lysophospholipase
MKAKLRQKLTVKVPFSQRRISLVPSNFLPIEPHMTQRFESIHKIDAIQIPTFFIHGLKDKDIPPEMSARLFERSGVAHPHHKAIHYIKEGRHSGLFSLDPTRILGHFEEFMANVYGPTWDQPKTPKPEQSVTATTRQ